MIPAAASPLSGYLELRSRLTTGGWETDAAVSLADSLTGGLVELADPVPRGVAVIATGGFGRGWLALRSDVDLLVLHSGRPDPGFVQRLLRPLWDAGLRVGHSVRTPRDAVSFASGHTDTLCSLLTVRLVAGDEDLLDDLVGRRLRRLVMRESSRVVERLVAEERARRASDPYRPMAMDLKRGRGGLRTLDMVDWAHRVEAFGGGKTPAPAGDAEVAARTTLYAGRSALHALTGRPHDVYDFELRAPAAEWLGTDVLTLGRELLEATSSAEALADEAFAQLRTVPRVAEGRIPPVPRDPVLAAAVSVLAEGGTVFLPEVEDRVSSASPPEWTASDLTALIELTRVEARVIWRRLLDLGWFERALPEWAALGNLPHVVPFHTHPVGDHCLATVDEMRGLLEEADSGPDGLSLDPGDAEPLLWAALLHDIGKARQGDHSDVGEVMVAAMALRLRWPTDLTSAVTCLVRDHLLLADLATRFDIEDPAVASWAVDRIGDPQALHRLYFLTVADSRAASPALWTPWRADLVRCVHRRLRRLMTERSTPDLTDIAERVAGLLADGEVSAVVTHLAGFTAAYRLSHPIELIAEHMRAGRLPLGPGDMRLIARSGPVSTRLILTGTDRAGLLTAVSGVLALERLSIIDARFATRSDGRVFDTFDVVDALEGGAAPEARLRSTEETLSRVLRGSFDLESALAVKQRDYRNLARPGVEPVVNISRTPGGGGVVEVEAADRLGLLHDLGRVFQGFSMAVVRARIDTRAGVAYDAFTVTRLPADVDRLRVSLEDALRRTPNPTAPM